MKWAKGVLLAAVLGAVAATPVLAQSNVQFSGVTIQSTPDGKSRQSKLYVGDDQVRLEHNDDGQEMVEIYDMKNHRMLLLSPQQKIYMQRDMPPGPAGNPMVPPKDTNPCVGLPDAHCKKLGAETLYGRRVIKWEMTAEREGKPVRSLHWIDAERHMSLRDVWPDGSVTQSILQGKESLDGRATERWQRTTTDPDGKKITTTVWYDPQLQIAIREELPDGFFREITNIHVAPQPPDLFQVPAGYRRVEGEKPAAKRPPQPGGGQQTR